MSLDNQMSPDSCRNVSRYLHLVKYIYQCHVYISNGVMSQVICKFKIMFIKIGSKNHVSLFLC